MKSALAAKSAKEAEAAPAAGEGFTRELFNAWRAADLYASPDPLSGSLTFVCPECPHPEPLDIIDEGCRCGYCAWSAEGTPKEIVARALAARGAAPTAPAHPPAEATGQRLDWPRLYASLDARKFDVKSPPPPSVPVVKLGGVCIATQGNIQAIQAMAKAGKTAFLGALIASAMNSEADCFGLEAENPRGLAMVHFDTEQSPQDHFRVVQRALTRAQQAEQPPWLKS